MLTVLQTAHLVHVGGCSHPLGRALVGGLGPCLVPAILPVGMASDSVFNVIFARTLRISPAVSGDLPVVRMYRFQPADAAAVGIRQPRVNLPLRAAPAPGAIVVGPEYELRYRCSQHAKPGLA